MENGHLTEAERSAKDFTFLIATEGEKVACDTDLSNYEAVLPKWYDEAKYKRAQKYFANNRSGILISNMVGLITLLSHHKGLQVLSCTGRSSTPETARKRYVSTVLHTLSWYEVDLTQGSKSWESLLQVRKMHLNASRCAQNKNLGCITQTELAATQFGFMGFALIRPHIFNIIHDNDEDIEAFIHLWAVVGFMLGIKDQYNICLRPVEVVKVICAIFIRYFTIPVLQLEPPEFKEMTKALLDGFKHFMPSMSYNTQMFIARKAACVPGYQYRVDLEKEILCRDIFTEEDIAKLKEFYAKSFGYEYMEFVHFARIPVYNFNKNELSMEMNGNVIDENAHSLEDVIFSNGSKKPLDQKFAEKLRRYLGLDKSTSISLTFIDYEKEWKNCLNDSKFYELSPQDQKTLELQCKFKEFLQNRIGRYIRDWLVSLLIFRFRWFLNTKSWYNLFVCN